MLEAVFLWSLLGFLSGPLPFSVWLGRLIARADVRRYGDGNPGATNTWWAGVPAILLDYLKGAVPVATIFGIWTGLTLWVGPTTLGLTLALALALISADAWLVMLGMLAPLVSLLLQQAWAPFLAVWAGNLALLIWKHRHGLRTPVRPRPWLRNVMRMFR